MKKPVILRIVNNVLFVLVAVQALSIIGFNVGIGASVLFPMHKAVGALLIVSAVIHLGLNWSWVKANYFRKSGSKISVTSN